MWKIKKIHSEKYTCIITPISLPPLLKANNAVIGFGDFKNLMHAHTNVYVWHTQICNLLMD